MTKDRLAYIDQLKGLAIIAVVLGHVSLFCAQSKGFVSEAVNMFHMPLFFLLSGLVVKQQHDNKLKNLLAYIWKKARIVLIPFFAWALIRCIWNEMTFVDFMTDFMKDGYWYLMVIFEFYLIQLVLNLLIESINSRRTIYVDMLVMFAFYACLKVAYHFIPTGLNAVIGYLHWICYIPYFFIGVLIQKYELQKTIFSNRTGLNIAIATLISMAIFKPEFANSSFLVAFAILFILFSVFMQLQVNRVSMSLATIGQHSLAIYVLHYFLIPFVHIETYIQTLFDSNNYLAILIVLLIVAMLFVYISIYVHKLLSHSKIISRILFGQIK